MSKDTESELELSGQAPQKRKHKGLRLVWRIFRNLMLLLLGLVFSLILLVQMPFFQTWMGKFASNWLYDEFGVNIQIQKVSINFFRGTVNLKNVYAGDDHQDTLIFANILRVKMDHINLKKGEVVMKEVVLEGGLLNMRKYKGEAKPNLSLLIDKFKSGKKKEKKKGGKKMLILSHSLILDECDVRIRNDDAIVRDADFLPNDIRIHDINGKIGMFSVLGDSISFKVSNLSATEESGIIMRSLSSSVLICPTEIAFKNFKLKTPRSQLSGYYSMRYRNWSSFSNFIDSVTIVADLDLSNIDMKDIAFFAGGLKGIDANFRFKGGVKGTISNLKGRDIALYFGSVTQLVGKVEMMGLPDINNTFIFFDLNKLVTNYNDLNMIPLPPFSKQKKLKVPVEISRMGVMKFSGNFTGFIKDFTAYGDLQTSIGSASVDMNLGQDKDKSFHYNGHLKVNNFHVGKLLNQEKLLGKVTMNGKVNGKNFDRKTASVNFDGNIQSIQFNNYDYRDVETSSYFKDQTFGGLVKINDPNINMLFNGNINLSDLNNPRFDFYSKMENVELAKLHFFKTDSAVRFKTEMKMNFEGKSIDQIVGSIRFFETEYRINGRCYDLDSLLITSQINSDSSKSIVIQSPFVDADFNGHFKFLPLINELKKRVNDVVPSVALKINEKIKPIDQNFDFNIQLKNTSQLTALLIPKLHIAFNSIVYGSYDSKRNDLKFNAKSGSVDYSGMKWRGISLMANNKGDNLLLQVDVDKFFVMDSIDIDNLKFAMDVTRDSVDLYTGFSNRTEKMNSAFLHAKTYLGEAPRYEFRLSDSYFYYEDSLWKINNNNEIIIDDGLLSFKNLELWSSSKNQPLIVLNGISKKGTDEAMSIDFNGFPMEVFNFFLKTSKVELDGYADGNIKFYRILESPYFTSNLTVSEFGVNKIPLGNLDLQSVFNTNDRSISINTALTIEGKKSISITNGKFYPYQKNDQFNILAEINELDLPVFEQFVNPIFAGLKGSVSGVFSLTGSTKDPQINSQLQLKNAGIRIVYLNAAFDIFMEPQRAITINNRGITIPPLQLKDKYDGNGYLEGHVYYELFKNISLDLDITAWNLCLMETNQRLNEQFYGKAFATGFAEITGPIKNLVVRADMQTEKNTVLNIPIKSTSTVVENSFVVFVSKIMDSTNVAQKVNVKPLDNNFTVELSVVVTPDATARIIFDETAGDVLTANGVSDEIRLELDTRGKFNLFGNYEITKGNYLFTLQNVINKPFSIKPGSSISFTGNPYYASINATAIYQATASLHPIVSPFMDPTTAEAFRRPTRVNCELTLSNTLGNLLIAFNLEVPQVDESTRSLVKSMINTEEEINRQVFALLVLNQFLPPEAIGGSASTNLISSGLGSTSVELLSGQLNNWLSKLTKDVNVNVKYKAGDNVTTDQVSVALSTQLFNDRIIIDGDLGVGGQRVNTESSQNQIVGNVTVEFKVNKKGNFRIKAFNRSNDNNLLKNSAPYTQGVGLSYRVDFDSWGDLFKRKKKKKEILNDTIR